MAQILVVDDSSFARKTIVKILQASGYSTIEAAGAEEFFEVLSECKPEVILLDLLMPGVGGLNILRELKSRNQGIPVIVLTADIQKSVRQECLEAGAVAVVNKPPAAGELAKAVAAVLGA